MSDHTAAPADRLTVSLAGASGSEVTLALSGELDPHTSPILDAAVTDAIGDDVSHLTLDLGGVGFVDSSGLRVLAATHRLLGGRDGRLRLTKVSPQLQRLLGVVGLDSFLEVEG